MSAPNHINPPKWPLKFLRFFVKEDYLEEIEGDMEEIFQDALEQQAIKKAKRLYAWEVLRLFRPNIIKPIKINRAFIRFDMIRHNFLIAFRNFKRFKNAFFINLIGLSTGLTCVFLIYLWINDELKFDKFHTNDARLFQVMYNLPRADGLVTVESTPGLLAAALAEEFPEVEEAAAVARPMTGEDKKGIVSLGESKFKANERYVSKNYFNVFSYRLIEGNKDQALSDKYAVLLSEELALKLFKTTENIIGKSIAWERGRLSGQYTVSGVFEKPPAYSTAQFDLLFSYELFFSAYKRLRHWGNSDPSAYVVLKKGTDLAQFNDKIKNFIKAKYQALNGDKNLKYIGTLFLQKYSDKYLMGRYDNGKVAGGRIAYVRLFSIIAFFLLLIACINFMNLATAKATGRLKEVGVKKVIGASRKTLLSQYLGESMLIVFFSLLVALVLVSLLLPQFNLITGKQLSFNPDTRLILGVIIIVLFTGLVSGSYPALYLSSFKPVAILKGKINTSIGELWARKGLVVFQFMVSVMLIVSVLVVYKQIEFVNAKNLGYNKDNIISFAKEGELEEGLETFLSGVKKMPGVVAASSFGHDLTGDHGGVSGLEWEGKKPDEQIRFGNLEVDFGLMELFGFEMKAGRTFSREFGSEESTIIFNEAAIEAMGLEDPIGKTVKFWGKERQIIGVAKNFHFESLYEQVAPCFFQCYPNLGNILIKIKAGMEKETIERIQQFYQEYNHGLPFEYKFLDEDYQALYASEKRVATLSQYFAGIAILISCLGLFGLATFTAERRLKEIDIRKILGSSVWGVIYLLSSDFAKMVITAIIVALPLSYIIARNWLNSFAYRIDLEWWFFVGAGLAAMIIALLTVGMQTFKAANINPVQCLRNE